MIENESSNGTKMQNESSNDAAVLRPRPQVHPNLVLTLVVLSTFVVLLMMFLHHAAAVS